MALITTGNNEVQQCMEDLIHKIKTVPIFKSKSLRVYDHKVFLAATEELPVPCAGVMFLGVEPNSDKAGGLSVTIQFMVIVVDGDKCDDAGGRVDIGNIFGILRDIREVVRNTLSPTGFRWQFALEAPFALDTHHLSFHQRWAVRATLTD